MVVTYTVQDGKSNYLEGAMVSCAGKPPPIRNVEYAWNETDSFLFSLVSTAPRLVRYHRTGVLGEPHRPAGQGGWPGWLRGSA